jgi:hypothetical protein
MQPADDIAAYFGVWPVCGQDGVAHTEWQKLGAMEYVSRRAVNGSASLGAERLGFPGFREHVNRLESRRAPARAMRRG